VFDVLYLPGFTASDARSLRRAAEVNTMSSTMTELKVAGQLALRTLSRRLRKGIEPPQTWLLSAARWR